MAQQFSPEALQTAQAWLYKKMQGKNTAIGAESKEAQQAYKYLSNQPEYKEALEQGQELQTAAFESGFKDNPEEFIQASQWAYKQATKDLRPQYVDVYGQGVSVDESKLRQVETSRNIPQTRVQLGLEQSRVIDLNQARQNEVNIAMKDYQNNNINKQQLQAEINAINEYYQKGTTTQLTQIPRKVGTLSFEGEPKYKPFGDRQEIVRTRTWLEQAKVKQMEISPVTNKPYGTISPAQSAFQRLKSYFKPEEKLTLGTVLSVPKRTLNLVGGELTRLQDIQQQKSRNFYQSQASLNAMGLVPSIAYFTPLAPILLVSGGSEKLLTPSGNIQIQQMSESLQAKGIPKPVSNVISWSLPVVEVGAGLLGLRGQGKQVLVSRELKAFEKTPLVVTGTRSESEGKGIDILTGTKTIGKTKYIVKVTQPFRQIGETKTMLEGGQGIAYRIREGKVTATSFESGGRAYGLETSPRLTQGQLSKSMEEFQSGMGRFYTKPVVRGEFKVEQGIVLPKTIRVDITGKPIKVTEPKTWSDFIGYSKEGEGYFSFVSGKPIKARVYPTGERSLLFKEPSALGIVRTKPKPIIFDIGESPMIQVTQKPTIYSSQILSEGVKYVAPTITKVPIPPTRILKVISPLITEQKNMPSIYAGTGTYERYQPSENIFVTPSRTIQPTEEINFGDNIFGGLSPSGRIESLSLGKFSGLGSLGKFADLGVTKTRFETKQESITKTIQKTKNILRTREGLAQPPSQRQPQVPLLDLSSLLKQESKPRQKFQQMPRFNQPQPSTKIPPLVPIFDLGFIESKPKAVKKYLQEQGFDIIFGVSKKSQRKMKLNLPREQAISFGSEFTRKTLRASFGLTPSGKQAVSKGYSSFADLSQFVPSKTRKGFYVEKPKYRLDIFGEKKEIQRAKKTKSKSKLKWW